ncbi:MAG: hypothetical protein AAF648_13470 [Pseudomonadota bacterium]
MIRVKWRVVLGLLAALPGSGLAAETVLFNESPAYLCYLAANERRPRDEGLEDCDAAIAKENLTPTALAATLSNRGLLRARGGAIEAALSDHDRAVRLTPEVASLFINRANAYTLREQFLPALQDLDYAVALGDEQVHLAFYNRALIHQRLGNLAAARSDAEAALATVPESDRYASLLESLSPGARQPDADDDIEPSTP